MNKPKYNTLQNSFYMVRRAWRDCKSVLAIALGIILCGVAANLLNLFVVPAVLAAVERGVSPEALVRMILGFTLALVFVHALTAYLEANTLFGRVRVRSSISLDVHIALCRTSFPHTEDPEYLKMCDKAYQCVEGNSKPGEAIWDTLTDLLTNLISFTIYLLLLAAVGPGIVVLSGTLAAVSYFAGERIRSWRYRHREEEADLLHRREYAQNCAANAALGKDVRIFGLGPWLRELFEKYQQLYMDFCVKREKVEMWADVLDGLLALARNGAAYGWLVILSLRGELSPAEFVLYFQAVTGFTQWVTGLLSAFGTLHRQSLELSTLREFLEVPESFKFEDGKPLPVKPDHLYTLELRDVSFRYPGADKDTLSRVNLTIRPGEKLAVVGRNGAGKTTLIKLLCGFYDPTEGQVLLDGEDIRQFNRRDYYRHFSAVFQQFSVLAGTIGENVAQAGGAYDRDRMWDCLERAELADKIRSLPKAEDAYLGRTVYLDGQNLSGGETQKLMLARALYKNAPMVVLDEPTAALDPIAESNLYQKYSDLTQRCTSVYISHRLASTRFCDRVLLLEGGGIAEEGTHESLLALNGRYAQMFAVQSKYYQEGEMEHD